MNFKSISTEFEVKRVPIKLTIKKKTIQISSVLIDLLLICMDK